MISETDTRQGLINPLFGCLGWDFSDLTSVRSEYRHPDFGEPVDYAFFGSQSRDKPVLLLEAKKLGSDLSDKKTVQQLCKYLSEFGVQWGVLTDGNRYVMYNSRGGDSYADQKFMMLEIATCGTDDGVPVDELSNKLAGILSKTALENENIQKTYEKHMVNQKIGDALASLLSQPFDTLVRAIIKEFNEDRVGKPQGYKVTKADVEAYLESIADEEGNINIELSRDIEPPISVEAMTGVGHSREASVDLV